MFLYEPKKKKKKNWPHVKSLDGAKYFIALMFSLKRSLTETNKSDWHSLQPDQRESTVQLGTVKLSRWRHWLNFIKTNGAAPRAAKSALQRSRLNWQLHQLWKSFELHERSKLDELESAVMIHVGRVLIAVFYHFLINFQSFLCFIGSIAQPWTLTQLSRILNTSIKQRLDDSTTL